MMKTVSDFPRFCVMLITAKDRATGKGVELYSGSDALAAVEAARVAASKPENRGHYVRFYDFIFLGGGMKDTLVIQQPNG